MMTSQRLIIVQAVPNRSSVHHGLMAEAKLPGILPVENFVARRMLAEVVVVRFDKATNRVEGFDHIERTGVAVVETRHLLVLLSLGRYFGSCQRQRSSWFLVPGTFPVLSAPPLSHGSENPSTLFLGIRASFFEHTFDEESNVCSLGHSSECILIHRTYVREHRSRFRAPVENENENHSQYRCS